MNDLKDFLIDNRRKLYTTPVLVSCDFRIVEDGGDINMRAYEASISYGDILFSCDEGTITYCIDWYSDIPSIVLFDWNYDEQ